MEELGATPPAAPIKVYVVEDQTKILKNQLKLIICKTKNGEALKGQDFQLVKALLGFHARGEEKLAGLAEIQVDTSPKFPATRCFFVVKEDGSRDDFSFHKCLENLILTHKK